MNKSFKISGLFLVFTLLGACAYAGNTNSISSLSQSTGDKQSVLALANRLQKNGNFGSALALYRQAYSQTNQKTEALLGMSKSLVSLGQYDEALRVLTGANTSQANNGAINASLGQIYLALGDINLSVQNFRLALQKGNKNVELYSGLGIALEVLGRHIDAYDIFNKGLSIYPDNKDLLSNFGLAQALSNDPSEGVTILESLVVEEGATKQFRQNLALAYFLNENYSQSEKMASIDLDPQVLKATLAGFSNIHAMGKSSRMRALLYGMANPEHDLDAPANPALDVVDESLRAASERVVKKPEPEPEPQIELPDLPPLMEPEGWAVQIAAYRFQQEIIDGWAELKEKYFDIIGHLEPRRSEINFGPREEEGPKGFFYRLNAGPLSGFKEARDICEQLQTIGGECWIRPPEPTEGKLPKDEDKP